MRPSFRSATARRSAAFHRRRLRRSSATADRSRVRETGDEAGGRISVTTSAPARCLFEAAGGHVPWHSDHGETTATAATDRGRALKAPGR